MRNIPLFFFALLALTTAASAAPRKVQPPTLMEAPGRALADGDVRPLAPGNVDVPPLGYWTFDDGFGGPDPQGWTTVDRSAQIGTFFHIENFDFVHPVIWNPLIGAQSLWCGKQPCAGPEVCNYLALPGYGNNWDQRFESIPFTMTDDAIINFRMRYDLETSYDYACLDYQGTSGGWQTLATFTGIGNSMFNYIVPHANHGGTIKFRFRVVSDNAFSDEDGLYNSEGAVVIDNLIIDDGGFPEDFQSFEGETPEALATADGHWTASVGAPYGNYAGLFDGNAVLQQDPAITNTTHLWGFFNGSTANYACQGHPEQATVPYVQTIEGEPEYIENEIRSPVVSLAGIPPTSPVLLSFDVYRALPLQSLIFYRWRVRSRVAGLWRPWNGDPTAYYSPTKSWYSFTKDMRSRIAAGATDVQVAIGVLDACPFWCGIFGDGACHSQSPLIDNVRIATYPTNTPLGSLVAVTPPDINTGTTPVSLVFNEVTSAGVTTLVTGTAGPVPPGTFTLGDGTYYDVSTTATYTGSVQLCLTYNEAALVVPEAGLRLLHWDTETTPPSWADITTSLDLVGNVICGLTDRLSPFVIGSGSVTAVGGAPRTFGLHQNVPNPFNPATTIAYDVPGGGADVSIRIYDVTGRVVRTLVDEHRPAGTHEVGWDGRNDAGVSVASGVYLYRMVAGRFVEAKRMVLLK